MPSLRFVERVPFPTLRTYVLISLAAVGACALFAWSHSKDFMIQALNITAQSQNFTSEDIDMLFETLTYSEHNQCLILAVTSQLWTLCVSLISKHVVYVWFALISRYSIFFTLFYILCLVAVLSCYRVAIH